ncbi:MAG: hypothetical protein JWM43_3305 [Acidobacteriaceae bacterium]|nr:hypothetical protein [Acidobacteriaceae bacterium]
MEVMGSCNLSHLPGVREPKPAADGDCYTVAGLGDQRGKGVSASQYIGRAAGGKNAIAAARNHRLQRFGKVRGRIEGSVKGSLERRSQLDQQTRSLRIDSVVLMQKAEDNARDSHAFHATHIFAYLLELGRRIAEIAGTGTQHCVNGQSALLHGAKDKIVLGGQSLQLKMGAKLNAIGAARGCSQASFKRLGAKFERDRSGQRQVRQR